MIENILSIEIIDFFMQMPVFGRINGEELKVVARQMSVMALEEGDILFKESEKGSFICFISEGELDVIKTSETTEEDVILATLNKGQSIGEMSIIDNYPRSATVKAKTKALLYILSKSAFDMILERHPRIGIKLLKGISKMLSENLRETSRRLADFIPSLS